MKHRRQTYLEGAAFGAFVSSLTILTLLTLFDVWGSGDEPLSKFSSILTPAATLFAAYLALRGISQQIQHNVDAEESRRQNRLAAARATLPAALSQLTQIAICNIRRHFTEADVVNGPIIDEFARVDSITIETIQKCIEYTDCRSRSRLSKLLGMYQILEARERERPLTKLDRSEEWKIGDHNAVGDVTNWAVFSAIVDSSYPFARGVCAEIPPKIASKDVYLSLRISGVQYELVPKLTRIIDEREKKGHLEMDFQENLRIQQI